MSQGEAERTCLWEDGLRECVLGIVGTGPGFAALAALAEEHDLEEFLPPMRLAGVACTPEQAAARGLDRRGTAHYDSWRELLAAHPDLTVLVDLREERLGLTDLRTALPPQVSLIDRQAAVFLCALHNMHRAGAHTRTRLGHSRALLDAVVTQIREDILLLDLQGRVLDMNPHVYQRTGRPKEELLGQPCRQVQTLARGVPFCPEPCADCPVQATLRTERKAEARMTGSAPAGSCSISGSIPTPSSMSAATWSGSWSCAATSPRARAWSASASRPRSFRSSAKCPCTSPTRSGTPCAPSADSSPPWAARPTSTPPTAKRSRSSWPRRAAWTPCSPACSTSPARPPRGTAMPTLRP
jgi:PAS domain-containing protein